MYNLYYKITILLLLLLFSFINNKNPAYPKKHHEIKGQTVLKNINSKNKKKIPLENKTADKKEMNDMSSELLMLKLDKIQLLEFKKNALMVRLRKLYLINQKNKIKEPLTKFYDENSLEKDKEYYYYMGIFYEYKGKYRKAVESFLKAIDKNQSYSKARNNLGNLYCKLHKFQFAKEHLLKAIEANPYNPFIHYNLGNLLYETGEIDSAIKNFENAIKYKANLGSAYYKLGILMYQKNNHANAIEYLNKALKFNKKTPLLFFYLGLSYYNSEQGSIAIANLKKAITMKNNFYEGLFELGKIYQSYGEYNNALESYNMALAINYSQIEQKNLKINIADCFMELKKYEEAIEIILNLLERDPKNEHFKKYLQILEEKKLTENLSEPYEYYNF